MMVLVDTSVWVDHLRRGNRRLAKLLDESLVVSHLFVIGELACGNLRNRREILGLLSALPTAPLAEQAEVLRLLDIERLSGRGLGWIDVHLLASARLMACRLWSLDKPLVSAAESLCLTVTPGTPR
ncbi:twitching motility protein PilT [Candidatus Methylomirabilis lanthanidiphila]|uniref:Ribonuclease VapC n=1 Tax=Candidatus Methylomirabilis lanthanidiphila TaxID=2211376 RepID=A0A564ZI93_9BACT|nr:PIN domain-containing protein [Candidatus Methylomirabilis lanthanidiphila]VUZ84883.1 twitching motility protein PilT [Candidatus Methylomirabilis lanthanidiphila]